MTPNVLSVLIIHSGRNFVKHSCTEKRARTAFRRLKRFHPQVKRGRWVTVMLSDVETSLWVSDVIPPCPRVIPSLSRDPLGVSALIRGFFDTKSRQWVLAGLRLRMTVGMAVKKFCEVLLGRASVFCIIFFDLCSFCIVRFIFLMKFKNYFKKAIDKSCGNVIKCCCEMKIRKKYCVFLKSQARIF